MAADKTQISIEQAQGVVENITQLPYEGRRRVFIVDSCHTPPLGGDAASALLKTLEEPPPSVTFVLLAANPRRVLPTIASRAVQLRVPPPSPDELAALVAAAQGCSDERAAELVAAAGGDAELALREGGERLPETLLALEELAATALAGDGLAILRTAATLQGHPGRDRPGDRGPAPPGGPRRRGGRRALPRCRGRAARGRQPPRGAPPRPRKRRGGSPRASRREERASGVEQSAGRGRGPWPEGRAHRRRHSPGERGPRPRPTRTAWMPAFAGTTIWAAALLRGSAVKTTAARAGRGCRHRSRRDVIPAAG